MKKFKIALIGNPNCGKTTVFNLLTGNRSKTGNYAGVTVETKKGYKSIDDARLEIVDLPGVYSLNAISEDEKVARDYILDEKIDIIVNIIDASNLEKSLFLTMQLMELGIPIVLALNMIDIADKRNLKIDIEFLKNILEVELVCIVASKRKGMDDLLKKVLDITKEKIRSYGINIKFENDIEEEIKNIQTLFSDEFNLKEKRLVAIKLLEEDVFLQKKLNSCSILHKIKLSKDKLEKKYEEPIELVLSKKRHQFIKKILSKAIIKEHKYQKTTSDKIDEVLINKFFGFPIFLIIMYLIFQMTFYLGSYPMNWIEQGFSIFSSFVSSIWPKDNYLILKSLVIDGIITGVGSVVVFMPNIMFLFLGISVLEDSGYMARAAFLLDRLMHKIGLHGKSFIPMMIGFGCTVPAIMATRCIESKKDRIITILSLPLIACSAKLVVFTLLIPAFFERAYQPIVLFSLYLIGIILAIASIKIFKIAFFKKESFSFLMELPTYQMPSFNKSMLHMWDRSKEYLKKAGTLILGFSILLWVLSYFPNKDDISKTYIGKIGKTIEPVFKPLGFDWKINASLLGSLASKEVFVSQLGIIYAIKDNKETHVIQRRLQEDYTPIGAFSIMLFILISTPCLATIAITKKETKSYKWALFQIVYLTILAYGVSFFVYRVGLFFFR
ncbi:MAG: ferrous iron transport protein B [Parachlamydiales bacterium]|jgi:ferrous iron transport protein B